MKQKFTFDVIQTVEVELDDDIVTQEFLDEFSEHMWYVDSLQDIAEYIARQKALFDGYSVEFAPDVYKAEVVAEEVELV